MTRLQPSPNTGASTTESERSSGNKVKTSSSACSSPDIYWSHRVPQLTMSCWLKAVMMLFTVSIINVTTYAALPGIRGTYQGLTATVLKQGSNQAIRFFVMTSLKNWYKGQWACRISPASHPVQLTTLFEAINVTDSSMLPTGDNPNKAMNPLVTGMFGAIAGAASVFGNTPLDVIKTRMQVGDLMAETQVFLFLGGAFIQTWEVVATYWHWLKLTMFFCSIQRVWRHINIKAPWTVL